MLLFWLAQLFNAELEDDIISRRFLSKSCLIAALAKDLSFQYYFCVQVSDDKISFELRTSRLTYAFFLRFQEFLAAAQLILQLQTRAHVLTIGEGCWSCINSTELCAQLQRKPIQGLFAFVDTTRASSTGTECTAILLWQICIMKWFALSLWLALQGNWNLAQPEVFTIAFNLGQVMVWNIRSSLAAQVCVWILTWDIGSTVRDWAAAAWVQR